MVLFIIADVRKIIAPDIYGQCTQKSNVLIPEDLFIAICIWLICNAYIIVESTWSGYKLKRKISFNLPKVNNWSNHISLCLRILKLLENSHSLLVSHARPWHGSSRPWVLCTLYTWFQMFQVEQRVSLSTLFGSGWS